MTKYRIKEINYYDRTVYEVEKKYWFLPFWQNINSVESYSFHYDTLKEANEALESYRHKPMIVTVEVA